MSTPSGRQGEVWQLRWIEAPATAPFGAGCAGSNGVPDLRAFYASQPRLGQALPLQLSNLPFAPGPLLLALGDSIAASHTGPLALDALGLPGCRAWIPMLDGVPASHAGVGALLQVTVPATPALAGKTIGVQAIVFDDAIANAWGSVSNALSITAYP